MSPRRSNHRHHTSAPSTQDVRLLTIDRIVGEGNGIGFVDTQTMFVPLTAPGDIVHAKVVRKQGNVLFGELLEVVSPSPDRVEPRVEFERSGGCDLQHLTYPAQLKVKSGIIQDALRRIAKVQDPPEIEVAASPLEWNYRSRAEFQIDHEREVVGYFAPSSNYVMDVEESPVLTQPVQSMLTALREDFRSGIVPKRATEYRAVAGDNSSVLEPTATRKSSEVRSQVGEYIFRYQAACFFQANLPIAAMMVEEVQRIAELASVAPGIAIDLYCGVGLFSLPIAQRFSRLVGVESFPLAKQWFTANLDAAGVSGAKFVQSPVERWIAGDRSPLGKVGLLCFDPPRSGAGPQVMERVRTMNPAHVLAISCDPATFARDIRVLLDGGYALKSVRGFDMFPQTHHVEIVAHLERT